MHVPVKSGAMSGDGPVDTVTVPAHLRRFDLFDRVLHGVLMVAFLGLAATGLPLLFAHAGWAGTLARAFGGFHAAGILHRIFAVVMIGVFITHVGRILRRVLLQKDFGILWGPNSMVPQPRDVAELIHHLRWFVGRGPRPKFDRFTYWEKFDYWAVFWGMGIIGGTGLMLWFPEFFARFLPGWAFNVALLVHGEEALLAVGFIFTIHFFNGHLRPEKFPMDLVIFTGRITGREMREERPAEFERLLRQGTLEALATTPPDASLVWRGRILGTFGVVVGLSLVGLIVFAALS
jgi:cytochrome b subunit of formate dehydrogenase